MVHKTARFENDCQNDYFWCLYCVALSAQAVYGWTAVQLLFGLPSLYYSYYFVSWFKFNDTYTKHEWIGLVLYIFLFPFAFILICNALTRIATFKHISINIRVFILFFFAIIGLWAGIFFLFPKFWNGIAYWQFKDESTSLPDSLIAFEMSILYIPFSIVLIAIGLRLIVYQKKFDNASNYGILPNIPFSFNNKHENSILYKNNDFDQSLRFSSQQQSIFFSFFVFFFSLYDFFSLDVSFSRWCCPVSLSPVCCFFFFF